ncbi:hypothetical protein [Streptomyces sp. SHP 1-2]|uniref:hypothetical protein n=1 Tax=Streptomyces sp. SHP 1-2 TaxID=2769489 RepID=UPI002238F315|nr:hypothetical protein [Streptomyces sp. SHP 1-2]MCW5252218.1 hypothetical protein [Streptomyces sp. SHP 1-2]
MPRIRVLQSVAGLDFSWTPGQVVDVSDQDADAWADGVRAELVEEPKPNARAEKAASRSRGGGRAAKPETR